MGPGDVIAFVALMMVLGAVGAAFSPIGRALARRLSGDARAPRADEVAALGADVARLERDLEEVQNRLDFAERVLSQARERGLLGAPKER